MPIAAVFLVALSLLQPAGAVRQDRAAAAGRADSLLPAIFRAERVVQYRDSFHLYEYDPVAGYARLVGWHRTAMVRHAGGFRYVEEEGNGHVWTKALEVLLDSALEVRSSRSAGRFFGRTVASNVTYAGRRARGAADASLPEAGRLRMPVDTLLPPDAFDALALHALLPLLDWKAGTAYLLPVFDAAESSITYQVLRIGEAERIETPAGAFDALPAELTTTGRPLRLWVTRTSPHRLVRVDSDDGRLRMVLVAGSPPILPRAARN
jgi:hypothetical protein